MTYKYDKAIIISPGMKTSLATSRVLERTLSTPYSNCETGYAFDLTSDDHLNRIFLILIFDQNAFTCVHTRSFSRRLTRLKNTFKTFGTILRITINGITLQALIIKSFQLFVLSFIGIIQINTKHWVRLNFARTFARLSVILYCHAVLSIK